MRQRSSISVDLESPEESYGAALREFGQCKDCILLRRPGAALGADIGCARCQGSDQAHLSAVVEAYRFRVEDPRDGPDRSSRGSAIAWERGLGECRLGRKE
ncbi:MAG: hypothetical protein HC869_23030 [Rhodospirillales bacterium]|nr:hypothetical protein [Rhodospirillales bacterium]